MKILDIFGIGLKIVLRLLENRMDPQKAYWRSIRELTKQMQEKADGFTEDVLKEDAEGVADRLADLRRRRMQVDLTLSDSEDAGQGS